MKLAQEPDEDILSVVEPIMANLMAASTRRDHAAHTRDFTPRLKSIVTPERLEEICENYQSRWGYFESREPVAIFRRADSVAVVWRLRCSKVADEFVAEVVIVEDNGRYLVDHVVFF
ncbi:MAG: hypothetical protein R3288_11120 [Woeseiaceae bacterium]|nr:hypothetical protein [Woeseiaceae bacterium]